MKRRQALAYLQSFGIPLVLALGAALAGAHAAGSRGVIVGALLCSVPMVLLILGLRFDTAALRAALGGRRTPAHAAVQWGPVVLVHSHHESRLAARGKELRVRGRLFCAGCCGIAAGTLAGDATAIVYLASGFPPGLGAVLTGLVPLAFVPIVARYTVTRRMPAVLRVVANALLAFGCWLMLLLADAWLASSAVNIAVLAAFGFVAFARHAAASAENHAGLRGRLIVRP